MFFILSKLFWAVARPLNFLFFLAVAGLLAGLLGYRRARTLALGLSFTLFTLFGFTQLPDYLLLKLEMSVRGEPLPARPAGIIVLGGGISAGSPSGVPFHLNDAADRLVRGLELKRLNPGARFIYSGGSAAILRTEEPETTGAIGMVRALYGYDFGMELESRSRTTHENAVEVAAMLGELRSQPHLLVTSAFHMPRALASFRKAGVNVVPVRTDFRADTVRFPFLTSEMPNQFVKMSLLVKEYFGLLAYYLSGRTDSLLPGR